MNDDFLTRFRKSPHPEFAASLYKRISQPMNTNSDRFAWRGVVLAVSAICAAFALILLVSPTARAVLADFIREIGGIKIHEKEWIPPADGWVSLPYQTVPLADAQSQLPFALRIPTWSPDGYTLKDTVEIPDYSVLATAPQSMMYSVNLTWRHTSAEPFSYIVLSMQYPAPDEVLVPPGGFMEEVTVNGLSAALYRGGTDESGKPSEPPVLTLLWKDAAGVVYSLSTIEGTVSKEDLVRMAKSIP